MRISKSSLLPLFGVALIIAVIFLFLRAPAPSPQDTFSPTRLRVLTTFFPLYDFSRNIGQDRIELDILFTQTPEVSSFRPEDIRKINQADVVIKNGVGLEPVLDDLIQSSDNKNVIVVDTSRGIALLTPTEETHGEEGESTDEERHDHEGADPHIWLDPQNAIGQVQNIRDALRQVDPENAAFYQQNTEGYIARLRQLDTDSATNIAQLPRKDFVAFHSAFSYFSTRYGLHQAAIIEEFPGKEPSPQYLASVIDTIKELGISAIFAEPQFSPKVVTVITRDLGLTVRVLDPIETGNRTDDSYISLMRKNLQTLEEALQ